MKRVQRKRTAGWRMPPNTVYVGRPTRWGNPFLMAEWGRQGAIDRYRLWLESKLDVWADFLEPLKGKDLACWCPLNKPCHADILLEFLERGN